MSAAAQGAVVEIKAEVLVGRPTVGSALRSCVSKTETEGDRERKNSEKMVSLSTYVSVDDPSKWSGEVGCHSL